MPNKAYRQRLIKDLIEREFISTQSEITDHLRAQGVKVTQATISRDVNELRLVRVPAGEGRHRYRNTTLAEEDDIMSELSQRFKLFVLDIDVGENIIVIKTDEGHATGIAYVIDKLNHPDVIGSLAGQNTILLVARSTELATELFEQFEALLV